MSDHFVAVISAGRPGNVPKMHNALGTTQLHWFVPEEQVGEYRAYGAANVVGSGGLCRSRNVALDHAADAGKLCVQLSDDLSRLSYYEAESKQAVHFEDALFYMATAMDGHGAKLAGAASTDNAYFFRKPYHTDAFVMGDLMLIDPNCGLKFDHHLPLKEDYDYTLAHLKRYGIALRCNRVMPSFAHRKNRGGAVAYRTPELEQQAIAYLKEKWPGNIVDNPRRENEVLLRWK